MNRGDVRIWVQQKMDLFVANEKEAILGQRLWTLSGVFFPQAPKPFLEKELFQRQIKKKKRAPSPRVTVFHSSLKKKREGVLVCMIAPFNPRKKMRAISRMGSCTERAPFLWWQACHWRSDGQHCDGRHYSTHSSTRYHRHHWMGAQQPDRRYDPRFHGDWW